MTKAEFLQIAQEYERQTRHHSSAHMMRKAPAYRTLIDAGPVIVPYIIEEFEAHLKDEEAGLWGMSWVLILMDITQFSLVQPEPVMAVISSLGMLMERARRGSTGTGLPF